MPIVIVLQDGKEVQVKTTMTNPLKAGIKIRPFARQVLAKLSESFEIVIFTASHSSYANKVINMLDPDGSIIKFRMFRDHCI